METAKQQISYGNYALYPTLQQNDLFVKYANQNLKVAKI